MADGDYVQVYPDRRGEFRWRRRAANHENRFATDEGFEDQDYAIAQAKEYNPGVPVEVLDHTPED